MNKIQLTLLLALGTTNVANLAQASTNGNLSFQGRIDQGTCILAAGDVNRTITLTTVRVSDFDSTEFVGVMPFELTALCDSDLTSVTFTFSGTPAVEDGRRFLNTGTADGVGLWLHDSTQTTIRANGTPEQRSRTVATTAGQAVLPLGAGYAKMTPVSKGSFESAVTVDIVYN